ncbi:hypothetical protein [Deinococcus misasensis]|uniref:hypothetical protein n=1 Tax=Deinococcus misasensis TaxID=392413 RepID=UPI0005529E86|nr:hypothetical protein [Deinococcus misasensis]
MNPISFELALKRGLGRALQELKMQPHPEHRKVVLQHLVHCCRHDPQIEGIGSVYLLEAAGLAGLTPELPSVLIQHLEKCIEEETTGTWDAGQVVQLLGLLAPEHPEITTQLLDWYSRSVQESLELQPWLEDEILQVCRLNGLRFMLQCNGKMLDEHPEQPFPFSLLDTAKHVLAMDPRDSMQHWATTDPDIRRLIQAWPEKQKGPPRKKPDFTYGAIRAIIDSRPEHCMGLPFRGRQVSEDVLLQLANDLEQTTDPELLAPLLCVFQSRPFPKGPEPLIELAQHTDEKIAVRALSCLEHFAHPEVRRLALEFLTHGQHVVQALSLFKFNFQTGDEQVLQHALDATIVTGDPDDLWNVIHDLTDITQKHPTTEMLEMLTLAFPHQPCSHCRLTLLKVLHQHDVLPSALLAEAAQDLYEETREWASQQTP